MGHKTLIDGVGYEITGGRCLVDGVGYSIQKGRTLVDGVGYDVGFGGSAGDLKVGASVFANVDGVRTEFIIVHQGLPDATLYDASCDGTWVLKKDTYGQGIWGGSVLYKSSRAHTEVNTTFFGLLDTNIQNLIKTVKIPYLSKNNSASDYKVSSGADGLPVKAFNLSGCELGWPASLSTKMVEVGACLSFFSGTEATDSKRIAFQNGTAGLWWTRDQRKGAIGTVLRVGTDGGWSHVGSTSNLQFRPAFILDSGAAIDPDTFDILG